MQGKRRIASFVPAALTPIEFKEIYHALTWHIENRGLGEFEQAVSTYLGVKKAYAFTSFMRAIYACLVALKRVDRREEVIIPRYSCPTFAHAILASGLKIRYCDVSPLTLSIDMGYLRRMDLSNVMAVICVNHFGLSNPLNEVSDLCRANAVYLIEDLGYALGSEYQGQKLGTTGDFSVLNFQEGKAIPVGGGMVTTNHEAIMNGFSTRVKDRPSLLTMLGYKFLSDPHAYFLFMRGSRWLNYDLRRRFSMESTMRHINHEYDYTFNLNGGLKSISNFQGALGCQILSRIDRHMAVREQNAARLEDELGRLEGVGLVQREPGVGRIHYIRYPILVKKELRSRVLAELWQRGIEASPMYAEYGVRVDAGEFPGTERVLKEMLTLPCHPGVDERDLGVMVEVMKELSGREKVETGVREIT